MSNSTIIDFEALPYCLFCSSWGHSPVRACVYEAVGDEGVWFVTELGRWLEQDPGHPPPPSVPSRADLHRRWQRHPHRRIRGNGPGGLNPVQGTNCHFCRSSGHMTTRSCIFAAGIRFLVNPGNPPPPSLFVLSAHIYTPAQQTCPPPDIHQGAQRALQTIRQLWAEDNLRLQHQRQVMTRLQQQQEQQGQESQ